MKPEKGQCEFKGQGKVYISERGREPHCGSLPRIHKYEVCNFTSKSLFGVPAHQNRNLLGGVDD